MRRIAMSLAVSAVCLFPMAASAGWAEKTVKALEALAQKGSMRAQFELADLYESGKGTKRDARRALSYYCQAARQGHAEAAYRAGQMHIAGNGGVTASDELGHGWMRRAAWLGYGNALRYVKLPGAEPKAPEKCEPPNVNWNGIRMPPAEVKAIVAKLAPTYGLDPDLVLAVIAVESGFRPGVVSPKSAMGLMQLIPETAQRFGVTDAFDPTQNIRGGMKYLRWLLAYFDGDVTLALAGYNAGEGAVTQYKGVPPYRETQDYVVKVHGIYAAKRHPFDRAVVASAGLKPQKEQVAELSFTAPRLQPKRVSMED
ncbi:transglycosylase SLT domain-containing protein [Azospirillum sp. RWY-5-1]|uniref:Transglycosylase SLT domain-containing protein n=1 Tax=Azospirillum oleiclasticum TaxID=2735135 RepID=A0ABX2TAA1_9PROT|nr:transglycosylase SLT domain-containing protein [Azospirillum oleiclasticum]NYZ17700.1 transglycosylase SLT domain-containing protein [Azospirillum oleiclasticum]NYZ21178.1 transglycosylase SLT domain-containing protein [Azospirillum oleiclasticum]